MNTRSRNITLFVVICWTLFSCNSGNEKSDAFGNFEADDLIISAEAGGRLISYQAEEGSDVKSGEQIAGVDTMQLYLQKNQLISQLSTIDARNSNIKSQMAVIQQQIINLERDKKRLANMFKDGAATLKQMDDVTGNLDVLDKQLASTRSQLQILLGEKEVMNTQMVQIDDKINRCRIMAPISGVVLESYKKQGELIGQGQSLLRMADLSSLNLRVYFSGDQLPHIKIGQKVKVLIDETRKTNQTMEGTIVWISSEAEFTPKIIQTKEERVKLVYAVKVKVANDGRLKIGMPGEVVL